MGLVRECGKFPLLPSSIIPKFPSFYITHGLSIASNSKHVKFVPAPLFCLAIPATPTDSYAFIQTVRVTRLNFHLMSIVFFCIYILLPRLPMPIALQTVTNLRFSLYRNTL